MDDGSAMRPDDQPQAVNDCPEGHAWASHHGDAPLYVRICYLCGAIDWADLAKQAAAIRVAGEPLRVQHLEQRISSA